MLPRASAYELPATQVQQGSVRVRKPKQTQQTDDKHLADNGKTINNEGGQSASDRRFDQVEQVHNTAQLISFRPGAGASVMNGPRTAQAAPSP